jgi:hypothetical protein
LLNGIGRIDMNRRDFLKSMGAASAALLVPRLTPAAPDEFAGCKSGLASNSKPQIEGGAVWIDAKKGVAGTEVGFNGTPTNPVNNLRDAKDLATKIGVERLVFLSA